MSDAKTQFFIDGYVAGESGLHTVIGRNGDLPIRLGDVFTLVARYRPRCYPDDYSKAPQVEIKNRVNLQIVCLQAYRHELDELSGGMTGSVALIGEGTDMLGPGWVLESAQ